METNNSPHRYISGIRAMLLIGLVVLIVAGVIVYFSKSRIAQPHSQLHLNVPSNSNHPLFGFDLQRTRFNQSDHLLNTSNVSQLISYSSPPTAPPLNSPP